MSGADFLSAQTDSYYFENINIQAGLSRSTVSAILMDQEGYLWIGTANGLNKYDGYTFSVFRSSSNDQFSLSDKSIGALLEDSEKTLWIGTSDGTLHKYNRSAGNFIRIPVSSNSPGLNAEALPLQGPLVFSRNSPSTITSLCEDFFGNIWIGTWADGLIRFNKKTGEIAHYKHSVKDHFSISSDRISCLLAAANGDLWIGSLGGGLMRLRKEEINSGKNSFIRYPVNAGENKSQMLYLTSIFGDESGKLWIGTFNSGIFTIEPEFASASPELTEIEQLRSNSDILNGINVMDISADRENNLWIATFGSGIIKYNKTDNSYTRFIPDPTGKSGFGDDEILSLYSDRNEILWAGSHLGAGLIKIIPAKPKFNIIRKDPFNKNSLNDDVVWSINKDSKGLLWFGTYRGGLNRFDPVLNKFTYFLPDRNRKGSISDSHIRAITEDRFSNLWVGTFSGGLNLYNRKTAVFRVYKNDPANSRSIGSDQVLAIYFDSKDRAWIGTYGGGLNTFSLNDYPDPIFRNYRNISGDSTTISDDRVYTVSEENDSLLWIGTFGGGLNLFNKNTGRFKRFLTEINASGNMSDIKVISIYNTPGDLLWAGTYGAGLIKFNKSTAEISVFNEENGLYSNVVYGILSGNDKTLWLSTDYGIIRFETDHGIFSYYGTRDGVQNLEFSGGAYFKDSSGFMYFGGISGLNYFHPDDITEKDYNIPVAITRFKIFNETVPGTVKEIELSYNKNFFSFEFAALNFIDPGQNKYAFIMEGLDKKWNYADSRNRSVNYSNLSPGTYIFKVKAANKYGNWSKEAAQIKVIILPPFWKSWWFILITFTLGISIVWYFIKIRFDRLIAIDRIKTKLAADLHDNIGSGLTEIAILSELTAAGNKNSENKNLILISDTARKLIDTMGDIVWMINPKRDSLNDLVIKLKDSYSEILHQMGVSFKVLNTEKLDDLRLPMETRQQLFLILKEGINNTVKHSKCKRITLEVSFRGDSLEIRISDDGIGMTNDPDNPGNGLQNMAERARAIRGELLVESNTGEGTRISFIGKLNRLTGRKMFFSKFGKTNI